MQIISNLQHSLIFHFLLIYFLITSPIKKIGVISMSVLQRNKTNRIQVCVCVCVYTFILRNFLTQLFGAGKSKICRVGQHARNSDRS